MTALQVPGLPFDLTPSPASTWEVTDGVLQTTAHPWSDIFIAPSGIVTPRTNAATLLADPQPGDFQFSARVEVDFNTAFDAGVLFLRSAADTWAKLCFEYSPDGEAMVVSVVCRGTADDSNAYVVEGNSVWLRVSRIGNTYAYHASSDGKTWRMIRHFALDVPESTVQIGFVSQAPSGPGCTTKFDEIRYTSETLGNFRNGS
jgi:regulation of enolase protein 1 (concanavalin A-like superfamily)